MLDPEDVLAFVHAADLRNFTRAAEALGTTQSAISLKIKRLEERLGHRLIERTPRSMRLSAEGAAFLNPAREFVAAHDRAMSAFGAVSRRLVIGISPHLVGPELPMLLRRLNDHDSGLVVEMHVAASHEILRAFDAASLDAAILLRYEDNRRDGEVVSEERLGWFGALGWNGRPGEPLRLAAQAAPCGLRDLATAALDRAGILWTEVFVGGGVATIGAAISAGLAVAALVRRVAPVGVEEVGTRLSLPPLPSSEVVLHSKVSDRRSRAALQNFAAAFRATANS